MKILITVVLTIIVLLVAGLIFMYSGVYNVAASEGESPFISWVMSTIMEHSVKNHAPPENNNKASDNFSSGFREYNTMCVGCHGSPIQSRFPSVNSMVPRPPDLSITAKDWTRSELEWIIDHGIKMTGMPAFGRSESAEDVLTLATFVDTLPSLSVSEYRRIADSLK